MENNEDGFYCSQPPPKTARVTDLVWRRLKRPSVSKTPASSSENPHQNEGQNEPQNEPPKKIFAVSIDESRNWSKDVVDFYTNGDAPFCYTRFISNKLDRDFWGALLGCHSNRSLTDTHLEAWTARVMRLRQPKLLKNPSANLSWTVLPPCFYDEMRNENPQTAIDMTGRKSPYPPIWEVDTVYLPLWIGETDWLLISIDMQSMVLTQYWTDYRWRNEKKGITSHYMEVVPLHFGWFLDRIQYWSRSKHRTKCDITVGLIELNLPRCNGNIANSGVLVCMMLEKLVTNKPLPIEDDVDVACVNYRRNMADQLYYWRCVSGR